MAAVTDLVAMDIQMFGRHHPKSTATIAWESISSSHFVVIYLYKKYDLHFHLYKKITFIYSFIQKNKIYISFIQKKHDLHIHLYNKKHVYMEKARWTTIVAYQDKNCCFCLDGP